MIDPKKVDRLIAENLMDEKLEPEFNIPGMKVKANEHGRYIPNYSTDIRSAFVVVEKLQNQGCTIELYSMIPENRFTFKVYTGDAVTGVATHDFAPMAICIAALKYIGIEVEA